MRRALAVVLVLLTALLSGCLTGQGSFALATVTGEIRGGDGPSNGCSEPPPDGGINFQRQEVYWGDETYDAVPDGLSAWAEGPVGFSVLIFSDVEIPEESCGPLNRLLPGDGSTAWIHSFANQTWDLRVETTSDGLLFRGEVLEPGESRNMTVNFTAVDPDAHNGQRFHFHGNLTVTSHGTWPGSTFKVLSESVYDLPNETEHAYWS